MSAKWDDRAGKLTFENGDVVENLRDVLREIDQRLDWGQPTTCQAILRQALVLSAVPATPPEVPQ